MNDNKLGLTSYQRDILEYHLLQLLQDIKLVQGGSAVGATLRRHPQIKKYLIQKQIDRLSSIEDDHFPK